MMPMGSSNKNASAHPRSKHTGLKTARGRTPSSQRWLRRQLNDPFVLKAQAEGYRARSAYKLLEIDQKFALLRPGIRVVDIGCAPGGWLQVIQRKALQTPESRVVGIDLLPTEPLPGVTIITDDAREQAAQDKILALCQHSVDLVLSDMAAPMTGHARTDQLNVAHLAETAWEIADAILAQNGHFACKVYAGGAEQGLLTMLRHNFARVKHFKPAASRKESREMYLIALGRSSTPRRPTASPDQPASEL